MRCVASCSDSHIDAIPGEGALEGYCVFPNDDLGLTTMEIVYIVVYNVIALAGLVITIFLIVRCCKKRKQQ